MPFATATITSPTPAKDLMAALAPTLTAAGLTFVETYGTPPSAAWNGLAYGAGVFVAIASGTATAATSPDGLTWTQRSLPANAGWISVTYGGGQFVAIAASSIMAATSPDGITWTLRSLPTSTTWQTVTYGGGQFVAIAAATTIAATSPDGISWTQRVMPSPSSWLGVTYGAGVFVTVTGNVSSIAATSPDGITWTPRSLPASGTWTSVTYGGGLFVAVNTGGGVASSPDGITWTARTATAANYTSVTYGGGQFVAVASAGTGTTAITSPDGITWTLRNLQASASWYAVAYGGGVFAALAGGTSIAASSPDAINWTQRTLTPTSSSAVADVWKSPAASNQFGQDWYLLLVRSGDYATNMYYQVAEGYNSSTHRVSNYGGIGLSVAPATTTFTNPAAAVTPENSAAANSYMGLLTALPFTFWVSATANRVVVGIRSTVAEQGFYAGLYDDLLPAGTTQFPLVCARMPNLQSASGGIGGGSTTNNGGFTREPGQAGTTAYNFEARIHSGSTPTAGVAVVPGYGFTPATSANPVYGNPFSTARVMIGSGRLATNIADAVRGLLIGCVTSQALSVIGDTITSGGKTYVRLGGPTTTYGIYADQGL